MPNGGHHPPTPPSTPEDSQIIGIFSDGTTIAAGPAMDNGLTIVYLGPGDEAEMWSPEEFATRRPARLRERPDVFSPDEPVIMINRGGQWALEFYHAARVTVVPRRGTPAGPDSAGNRQAAPPRARA